MNADMTGEETMPRETKSDYQKLYDQIKFIADENGLNVLHLLEHNGRNFRPETIYKFWKKSLFRS